MTANPAGLSIKSVKSREDSKKGRAEKEAELSARGYGYPLGHRLGLTVKNNGERKPYRRELA